MELTLKQALQKGIEAHQAGKAQEAERYYTAILKSNPKHPDANHNMGVLAVDVGKVEEALPFLKNALGINPKIAQFWLSYIDALIKLGRMDDAKTVFDQAKNKGAKGDGFDQVELRFTNSTVVTTAIANEPDIEEPPSDHLQVLANLYTQGQYQQARTKASLLLRKFSSSASLYNILAATNQSLGKLEEAIEAYTKAIAIKPDYAEAYNNMGAAIEQQGKLDEAIEAYNKALSLMPDYSDAHNNMGNALKNQGKLEEAIESYNKAVAIKPDYAGAYYNMGNAFKDLGKLEKAIESYAKALSFKPDFAIAYNNMGNALKDQGKLEEAIEAYNKVVSFMPDYAEAYNNMGNALEDQQKFDEAVVSFQKAFEFRSGIVPNDDKALAPGTTSLFFELTNKCNFHCVFCPSDSQKRNLGSMNLELVKRLYTEASEKKLATRVNLHLMGEPTLHPKLIEILNFGASKNIKTDLVTNGSTLVAKIIPKILDSLYGTITASHMTPTKETYHFRGKVGLSWERYISNLRLLIREYMKRIAQGKVCKNDITIRVMSTMNTAANCTITENREEARSILKEWTDYVASIEEELGMDRFERVDYNSHDLLKENGSPSVDYRLQKGVKLTFWRAFTFANTRVSDDYELEDSGETAYCSHPFTNVGVLWNGDVTLCCLDHDGELSVGNINNSSIEEVIQNDAARKLRASMLGRHPLPSICQTCQSKPVKRKNANKINPAVV